MTAFLQKIAGLTRERVAIARQAVSIEALKNAPEFQRQAHDVTQAFSGEGYHIIAEVKFASPSEGDIHAAGDPVGIAEGYLSTGATTLSILTEPQYFKGDLAYLSAIRAARPDAILLRKEFIIDSYQLYEAKAAGADAALLIVAMTGAEQTKELLEQARDIGLTPLVEVHDAEELEQAVDMGADLIGVNNRNLKTLKIDLDIGRGLAKMKPSGAVFICESGLSTAEDVQGMRALGYDGFLMGSHFMRQENPGQALASFKEELS